MIHPSTELRFINEKIGFGVFATKFIPKGTIVWALDQFDQIIQPSILNKIDPNRRAIIQKYAYRNEKGQYVLCWDLGRYVNHSFHANCIGTAYNCEVAIRDIYPGEQLTDDYGTLNIEEPFECIKEEGTNRQIVYPDDLLIYYKQWDQQVLDALTDFTQVEQPLLHLIDKEDLNKLKKAAAEKILPDSIKTIFFDQSAINI
ncbi:MAG: SET domain-containing protein [Solibacillus sp.]|uniref:SET domain-containing protein n=1 Tax=unclassified Solibacillus TaxID=2637870 RepID=UPI0030FC0B7D